MTLELVQYDLTVPKVRYFLYLRYGILWGVGGPVTLDKTVTILIFKSRLLSLCEMKTNWAFKTSGSSMKKSSEKL